MQHHTFLWAYLVIEELLKEPPTTARRLLAALDHLPSTVVEAYEAILSRCTDPQMARKTLSIVVAARRPLSLHEMNVILSLSDGVKRRQDLHLIPPHRLSEVIRNACGLFLRITESRIYLFHQTARDFLLCDRVDPAPEADLGVARESWNMSIRAASSQYLLASACVRFLLLDGVMWSPSTQSATTKSITHTSFSASGSGPPWTISTRDKSELAFLPYAAENWAFHVGEALRYGHADRQILCIQRLIGLGLDMQMLDSTGSSLLHRAVDIHMGAVDVELVRCILSHGGLVQSADRNNMTCMHYAVLRGNLTVADILLEAGFDVDIPVTRRSHRRLLRASQGHDSAANCNPQSKFGLTPLHAAAFFGRPGIFQDLLDRGADVNAIDRHAQTALHLVLSRSLIDSRMDDMWDNDILMIDHVWDFDEEEKAERTYTAAQAARLLILESLCNHPNINLLSRDKYSRTPLHVVRYSHHHSEARATTILVQNGADRTARDEKDQTPIHIAARAGDVESLKVLVHKPEDLIIPDHQGRNALHFAAQSGCEDVVCFVLQNALSLDIHLSVDLHGRNALHLSLCGDPSSFIAPSQDVISLLLEAGVPANCTDHDGKDPLAYYVTNLFFNADIEIMALLVSNGANVQYEDSLGRNLAHHLVRIEDEVNIMQWSKLQTWGIEVDTSDHEERNVLHHASISGSVSVALLDHVTTCLRLDYKRRDVHGKTASEYASSENRRSHHPQMFRKDRWRHAMTALAQLDADSLATPCPCQLESERRR